MRFPRCHCSLFRLRQTSPLGSIRAASTSGLFVIGSPAGTCPLEALEALDNMTDRSAALPVLDCSVRK